TATQPAGGLPVPPVQSPPLPPRASVDQERKHEEEKKDKHKSKRISRLFSTKKTKPKEHEHQHEHQHKHQSLHKVPSTEGPSARSVPSAQSAGAVDSSSIPDEEPEESTTSPAMPSRPLPQPSTNPFTGRPALPQLPKVPPAPSAAVPPPPAGAAPTTLGVSLSMQPLPAGGIPLGAPPILPVRRPSASSVASGTSSVREGSVPLPPLPQVQQVPKTVDEEGASDEGDDADKPQKEDEAGSEKDDQEEGADEGDKDAEEGTAPASKPRGDPKLAKIIEDYEATSNEELNLISGDVVTIIHRGTDDEPRWKGEYHGKKGYFPSHVVEAIEESAGLDEEGNEDESAEGAEGKPKGFKLAAYGVQQGGLGAIFAGGGMPMLRKSAPSSKKETEAEESEDAPVPAAAPVMHKLRSVRRPPLKEEVKEEVPNFLAQLNRVPRKSSPSNKEEEEPVAAPAPAPAPAPALLRKALSRSSTFEEPAVEAPAVEEPVAEEPEQEAPKESAKEPAKEPAKESPRELPKESPAPADAPEPAAEEQQEDEDQDDDEEIASQPEEKKEEPVEKPATEEPEAQEEEEEEETQTQDRDLDTEVTPDLSESSEPAEQASPEPKQATLEPIKAPSLPHVKRLVRRAPRQKPTSEGLKKQVEEDSQSKALQSALEKDKDAPVEEPPVRAVPPPVAEKPKGLGGRSHFGGPQLPTGGFKATGRVGSAMAERLAALQARASGAVSDEPEEQRAPSEARRSFSPPQPRAAAPVVTHAEPSGEWQRQVEEEQRKMRQEAEVMAGRLRGTEQELTASKQTVAKLERALEAMTQNLNKVQEEAGQARQALARLEASQVSKEDVAMLLKRELQAAVEPLRKQTQELRDDNSKLRDEIKGLKTYIDELVVEEE
ncbi:hypothetical protein EC988_001323, partial [Linderina pennispora]